MKQSQFRNVIVSGMLACALLVAIALRHGSPPPVYDESGERLESLFAGVGTLPVDISARPASRGLDQSARGVRLFM